MNYNIFTPTITPKVYTNNYIECPNCHNFEKREIIDIYKNQILVRCYNCGIDFETGAGTSSK
jgi:uncharacterized Zn finger protein